LNKTFKSRWRKGGGNTIAKTFSFKKTIVHSILLQILHEQTGTLAGKEARVLAFVIKGLNAAGTTLNQYYLLVQRKSMPRTRSEEP